MRYLLDTNVISDARRRSSPSLDAWIAAQPVAELAISAITLLELDIGIRRKERQDPVAGAALRRWLGETVSPMFAGRVLAVDEQVALQASRLHVPDRMADMDSLIAATALVHGLTLVTRNTRDMERTGVSLLNPWLL